MVQLKRLALQAVVKQSGGGVENNAKKEEVLSTFTSTQLDCQSPLLHIHEVTSNCIV
jgi:hypothetical protein